MKTIEKILEIVKVIALFVITIFISIVMLYGLTSFDIGNIGLLSYMSRSITNIFGGILPIDEIMIFSLGVISIFASFITFGLFATMTIFFYSDKEKAYLKTLLFFSLTPVLINGIYPILVAIIGLYLLRRVKKKENKFSNSALIDA